MEQYIKKSAIIAEIERLKNTSLEYGYNTMQKVLADSGKDISLGQLQYFLDTLEVKEVDFEKKKIEWIEQLCKYFKANYLYVSGHESFISDFRRYAKNLK